MHQAENAGDAAPNHPQALRMGVIAGLSHNMVVGCLMGSFSVMIASVSARTGLSSDAALLGGPLVMLGSALAAPFVGDLIARRSLRLMMIVGTVISLAGFALLAFVPTASVYYGTYLLLFGPAMAICGSVGPATLVTRWFNRNRGLALGLVHLNLIVAVMPLLSNWILARFGENGPLAVYLLMALLLAALLVPAVLAVRDYPPGSEPAINAGGGARSPVAGELTMGQIARQPVFWCLATASSAIITGIMILTFTMVPLAESLGYSRGQGAGLQTIMAVSGMAGSVLFGWLADRLGGIRGLTLLAINFAVLLLIILLRLPFAALAVVIGLLGLHGAGMVPNVSRALAQCLGQGSFSRAFGLSSFLSVPFTGLGILGMSISHSRTDNYDAGLIGVALLLFAVVPLVLWAGRRSAD